MTTQTPSRPLSRPLSFSASLLTLRRLGLDREPDASVARRVIEEQIIDDLAVETLWATYLAMPLMTLA